jgi:hypothetical protein
MEDSLNRADNIFPFPVRCCSINILRWIRK